MAAQGLATWRLVTDASVAQDQPLTRILAILPAPDGSVVIADDRNQEVYVLGRDGKYVRSIGRIGRGPGEFSRLRSIGVLGDTLWVIDGREPRTSLFSHAGEFLANIRNDTGRWLTALVPGGALGLIESAPGSRTAFRDEELPVVLMTRAGRTVDTVARLPGRNRHFVLGPSGDGTYIIGTQPFSDSGLLIIAADSPLFFTIDRSVTDTPANATFQVTALESHGDTVWSRKYEYTPKRLERARRDSLLAAREPSIIRAGYSRTEIRQALFLPEYYPPVTSGFAGMDGSLWLRREEGKSTVDYWVLRKDGPLVATVTIPVHVTLMAATDAEAWGVAKDEYGVPSVTRYRIAR